MSTDSLLDRIDAALEKIALRGEQVRALYLTRADHDQFNREMNRLHKRRGCAFLAYGDHQIRRSTRESSLYTSVGVEVRIPKRLSRRVREAA